MTIAKGEDWGREVDRPSPLRVARGDRDLAALLDDGSGQPTAVDSGDLSRTLGGRPVVDRSRLLELPIDLVEVTFDDGPPIVCVAHVLLRSPWWRGGWWRGEVLAVMNAEFVGGFDVAPRGHPNDGRVETLRLDPSMGARQRWEVRRRLPTAQHLPHPQIATRPVKQATWELVRPLVAIVDGRVHGRIRRMDLRVRPDAAVVYA